MLFGKGFSKSWDKGHIRNVRNSELCIFIFCDHFQLGLLWPMYHCNSLFAIIWGKAFPPCTGLPSSSELELERKRMRTDAFPVGPSQYDSPSFQVKVQHGGTLCSMPGLPGTCQNCQDMQGAMGTHNNTSPCMIQKICTFRSCLTCTSPIWNYLQTWFSSSLYDIALFISYFRMSFC